MPWTKQNYPPSLKNFMAPVRVKAIEIANALLNEGYDEGKAIAIATAKAEEWAENRGKKVKKTRTS
ncbi:DUF2188 domain-containing protein [Arundinibacter roseus]|uniref:DUF2188 domain-containing protein n=1 Tax=Arundinibacter roseus TaxID=2070510 RepID=A0A4R4JVP6_9BACT|nr:DUF2188 domain-containing protein [Arundinibacter roseus]TDB58663.1 DUF2188 domain-containing protein [Arundinibacter roseus]